MADADEHVGMIGLRVPGSLGYRHLAIRLVTTACKMALESELDGVDPNFEPEVVSAFGEAFNNIAVHGYRDLPPGAVQIEVGWDAERLVITMIDTGRTFDPETIAPPNLDELPESGMGLFIMRACMDEVDYRPGPPNVLRLVKARGGRHGLLPDPPDHDVFAARELDAAVRAMTTEGAFNDGGRPPIPPGLDVDGDRGSHVDVVDGPVGVERTGHSGWRMKVVRPGELKEISRRK